MASGRVNFGLTLPNRGVVIGATTVAESGAVESVTCHYSCILCAANL
jgi:hypothetical protein